uniref:ABC transporter domain-containing protein n=1 Tax=Heterosigma akashiwo TaxID=2829 RepID=A0A6V1QMT5_HETAK|mmetsp:Transcript_6106/g.9733  ORF Transcript_6106/g.9733 Transcript_6106/m.9733 type:complete len:707 (-) Transcript_6106:563-2683(-)
MMMAFTRPKWLLVAVCLVCLFLAQPAKAFNFPKCQNSNPWKAPDAYYSRSRAPPPLRMALEQKLGDENEREGFDVQDMGALKEQAGLFWNMAAPFFRDEDDKTGRNLLVGVIGLTLLNSGVSVAFSYIGRDFWTALSNKNPEEFYLMLQKFMAALVAGVPVTVSYKFQRDKLALGWREWMTRRIMAIYYANRTYYALEASREVDNPDQRIAEDVRAFTKYSLDLLITLLTSVIDLVSFSGILFSIYPQLFGAILAYAGVGTVVTTQLGRQLIGLNFGQLQREADFRYSLMRVRENAESIAFYGGEKLERREIERRLDEVVGNFRKVIGAQRNLEFFTVSYRYLIQVIPGLVVAPLYFSNKIQLGVVSQSYGAFNHILGDLSIIVNQFEGLSSFSAGIGRLGTFLQRMAGEEGADLQELLLRGAGGNATAAALAQERAEVMLALLDDQEEGQEEQLPGTENGIAVRVQPGAPLATRDLTVMTPDGSRTLVQGLTLALEEGQHLLIVGESGTGKSSLLRTLAGLWTRGAGVITRPPSDEMFFLPQRPYCTLGSLRDQLTYPLPAGDTPDADLLAVLDKVDLGALAERMGGGDPHAGLNKVRDWSATLSLGEQQRLAFGRLLWSRPSVAILDEATSALDLTNERRMYELLRSELPGLSYVSVGHRPSLLEYHDTKLRLARDGFSVGRIDDPAALKAGEELAEAFSSSSA